jgi:dTMP kinase
MSLQFSRKKVTLQRPITIVLEGLDGVGKSTVAEQLAICLHARCLQTPPGIIKDFRGYFDSQDVPTRNAYYMIGNFLAGREFLKLVKEGESVVVDRYYASTIAYRTGKNLLDEELPPIDDPVYIWPKELPKPDYMFLLTLPEKDRLIRRASRLTIEETVEEKRIRMEPKISERINEVYIRLGCTEIQLVSSDDIDNVIQKILVELSKEIHPEKNGSSNIA